MFVTPPGDDPARPAGAPIAFADLISPSGRVGGRVTFGRWQSFGCRLVKVADPTGLAALLADFRTCPELWTTRVHPIINGASDYSRLARRTLTDAMNAKSLRELGQPRGSQ